MLPKPLILSSVCCVVSCCRYDTRNASSNQLCRDCTICSLFIYIYTCLCERARSVCVCVCLFVASLGSYSRYFWKAIHNVEFINSEDRRYMQHAKSMLDRLARWHKWDTLHPFIHWLVFPSIYETTNAIYYRKFCSKWLSCTVISRCSLIVVHISWFTTMIPNW